MLAYVQYKNKMFGVSMFSSFESIIKLLRNNGGSKTNSLPEPLHPSLRFKGQWRTYQEKLLNEINYHLGDKKLHVVAAPGAGKTVLGLEAVLRMGKKALILTPRTTIRDQWIMTLGDMFVQDQTQLAEFVSDEPESIRLITCITYQSVHSTLTKKRSKKSDDQFIDQISEAGVRTLVLDEAHHLTQAWGSAVEEILSAIPDMQVIALTATPPYDYGNKDWQKFVDICGQIDAEISVPELVQQDNLCPHQDYVIHNHLDEQETGDISTYRAELSKVIDDLILSEPMKKALGAQIASLERGEPDERITGDFIVACNHLAKKAGVIDTALSILSNAKRSQGLNVSDAKALDRFLAHTLRRHASSNEARALKRLVLDQSEKLGIYEDGGFNFENPPFIQDKLVFSASKISSVASICEFECEQQKQGTRICILCDRICDDALSPPPGQDTSEFGVVPIFKKIVPIFEHYQLKLAVLTGRLIIIPSDLLNESEQEADCESITIFNRTYQLIRATGDDEKSEIVQTVTSLFNDGKIHCLVGTAGLLGEGWNSPAVNSLILASYVGSFMLSNQMRGRALRKDPKNQDKVALIWHLSTIDPDSGALGYDMEQLGRRFNGFVGLHIRDNRIESGLDRMLTGFADNRQNNEVMFDLARQRENLRARWSNALGHSSDSVLTDRVEIGSIPKAEALLFGWRTENVAHKKIWRGLVHSGRSILGNSEYSLLRAVFEVTHLSLLKSNQLSCESKSLKVKKDPYHANAITISGALRSDRALIARSIEEVFALSKKPRYILQHKGVFGTTFFAVPVALSSNRAMAQIFHDFWGLKLRKNNLIYTRNPEGQRVLLEAEISSNYQPRQSRAWA